MEKRKVLMIPGPTEIPLRVIRAMMREAEAHYSPHFNEGVLEETLDGLKRVFQTRNEVIAVPGSGRVALEAPIISAIEEDDNVLCIESGGFGPWMTEMVRRVGGKATPFTVEWGKPIDLDKLEEVISNGNFNALTVVHNETTTGAMYPLEKISKLTQEYDMLFFVDTVSSLGGVDIRTDDLKIDFNMTASHKCLAAPIGLSIISISEKGWEKMENRKKPAFSFSYDLLKWKTWWLPRERGGSLIHGWRRQPITMPVHLVYALNEAVKIILEEGLERVFKRHEVVSKAVREAVRAIGLRTLAEESVASHTVSAVLMPEGVSDVEVRSRMANKHGIMISGGLGKMSGKMVRIGHMGVTASPDYVIPMLNALETTLTELGYRFERDVGVKRAMEILEDIVAAQPTSPL
ncbi:MAG: alanine--glyoxylate aminotransferase family protein [Candidatus Bathyarchaeia archaeon]